MKISPLFFLILICIISFPLTSDAMEVSYQFPAFDSRLVRTTDPLTVVFDQSLDTASVDDGSFYITLKGDTAHILGAISFETTYLSNDTVIYSPNLPWGWGARYQLHVTSSVQSVSADSFSGLLPFDGIFAAIIPNDMSLLNYDPSDPLDFESASNVLIGYNPLDPEGPANPWEIPGMNVTGGWKYTIGDPGVLVAIVDNGIKFYDHPDIRRAFFLNAGELPLPNQGGTVCSEYDCNGDGRFDVDDYETDDRLPGGGGYSALDLINTFSDGVDDDGNGLPDDISGWDFLRGTNISLGVSEFPEGVHGGGELGLIVTQGDNGIGSLPGVCPECMVLPVRTSAVLLYDYNILAAGVRYASSMGASVINFAGANFTWSQEGHQAFVDAYDNGAVTVAASGDEMSFHHWMPAAGEEVINVKTIFPFVPVEISETLDLGIFGFTETYCTNYGTHCQLSVPAKTGCTSDSTGNTSGLMGLIYSYAKQQGIEISADEVKQIITMTTDDIESHCASIVHLIGVCQPGYDEHFGYGRPELERALRTLGDPDFGLAPTIPPSVRFSFPKWWQNVYPDQTPYLDVIGQIQSRVTPFSWEVQIALGNEPFESEFITVDSGQSSVPIDGLITSINLENIFSEQWLTREVKNQYTFEVTLRVQAGYLSDKGTVTGESRKSISVLLDNDEQTGLVSGFPVDVGASGESAPILYDIDGDQDLMLEVIFGGGDGKVYAFKHDPNSNQWAAAPGFPVDISGNDLWVSDSIFASLAVGDIFGDGTPEIVAATMQGRVYVIDPAKAAVSNPILPGFPVSAETPDNTSARSFGYGNGFLASPLLTDLDMDGILEIVAASVDQKVYAWKLAANGEGVQPMSGWPVLCRSEAGNVEPGKECIGQTLPSQIIGTPAVGILNPSSDNPDISDFPAIVVSTTESCDGESSTESRVYAIFHNGYDNFEGPFLPGWPMPILAPLGDSIPIPIAAGSSSSPAISPNPDGADIAVGTTAWFPMVIRYSQESIINEVIPVMVGVSFIGSPSFSSIYDDGELQYLIPLTGALRFDELGFQLLSSAMYAVDIEKPHRVVVAQELEDIPMLTTSSVADLDNDGIRETIAGTGGYIVHAISPEGKNEIAGWPKYTQKWIMAAPAVGDMDADGKMEVVVHTREGVLYAWNSIGDACPKGKNNSDWRRYHHDERNTGYYGMDTLPPNRVVDLDAKRTTGTNYLSLDFTAPGDDWRCGRSAQWDIRYSKDQQADLSDPAQFEIADVLKYQYDIFTGGEKVSIRLDMEGVSAFAMRAYDEQGHVSFISNVAYVRDVGDDDDSDDDDDDDDDDTTDDDDYSGSSDDDDEGGRCCG